MNFHILRIEDKHSLWLFYSSKKKKKKEKKRSFISEPCQKSDSFNFLLFIYNNNLKWKINLENGIENLFFVILKKATLNEGCAVVTMKMRTAKLLSEKNRTVWLTRNWDFAFANFCSQLLTKVRQNRVITWVIKATPFISFISINPFHPTPTQVQ